MSVKMFRNFKENGDLVALNVGFQADGLSGGVLLGVRGSGWRWFLRLGDWCVSTTLSGRTQ